MRGDTPRSCQTTWRICGSVETDGVSRRLLGRANTLHENIFHIGSSLLPSAKVRPGMLNTGLHSPRSTDTTNAHTDTAMLRPTSQPTSNRGAQGTRKVARSTCGSGVLACTHRVQIVESFLRICEVSKETSESKSKVS